MAIDETVPRGLRRAAWAATAGCVAVALWWTADLLVAWPFGPRYSLVPAWGMALASLVPPVVPARPRFRCVCLGTAAVLGAWYLLTLWLYGHLGPMSIPVPPVLPAVLLLLIAGCLAGRRRQPASSRQIGGSAAAACAAGLAVLFLSPPFTTVPDRYLAVVRPGASVSDSDLQPVMDLVTTTREGVMVGYFESDGMVVVTFDPQRPSAELRGVRDAMAAVPGLTDVRLCRPLLSEC